MQGKHLYEYAVIRVLPVIERGEFVNVGLILFSKRAKYIHARFLLDPRKTAFFPPDFDFEFLKANLEAFCTIAEGCKKGGTIASLDLPERFRWLTAVRSTTIQTSRPHPGFAADLDQAFDALFRELVL
ncbi:DUF3037 domain-containing protein [Parabacteroides sp. Marseille-P3160]|uniref:DUF3037 domain-containing protein n=1 Tax=Parabacteroides sp. Marseille-P3160 TaxID=1917887 RepID=UPI0009B93E2D|nr:DUF3037 domain-containing protein [Parabacteroides sp. Marseille-P3160]